MAADDDLMNTKWGRITSQEWLRRRYLDDLERWLPPEKLHLIFTRQPYYDAWRNEIRDLEFEALVRSDPDAAWQQLHAEFGAFRQEASRLACRQGRAPGCCTGRTRRSEGRERCRRALLHLPPSQTITGHTPAHPSP